MSRQALKTIAFPAKEPNRNDLSKVLELANRLMDREQQAKRSARQAAAPDNVICFPGVR